MQFDRQVNFVTKTDGKGYWSDEAKTVRIIRIILAHVDETNSYGELRAYFDPREWDIDTQGLIYTDPGWLHSFRNCMATLGFSDTALAAIGYTEQGMQEENYVSLDVGSNFIAECTPFYRFAVKGESVNN